MIFLHLFGAGPCVDFYPAAARSGSGRGTRCTTLCTAVECVTLQLCIQTAYAGARSRCSLKFDQTKTLLRRFAMPCGAPPPARAAPCAQVLLDRSISRHFFTGTSIGTSSSRNMRGFLGNPHLGRNECINARRMRDPVARLRGVRPRERRLQQTIWCELLVSAMLAPCERECVQCHCSLQPWLPLVLNGLIKSSVYTMHRQLKQLGIHPASATCSMSVSYCQAHENALVQVLLQRAVPVWYRPATWSISCATHARVRECADQFCSSRVAG